MLNIFYGVLFASFVGVLEFQCFVRDGGSLEYEYAFNFLSVCYKVIIQAQISSFDL